jgi:hypothetical protein
MGPGWSRHDKLKHIGHFSLDRVVDKGPAL